MKDGYLMMVLHAHLPFVRHPGNKRFLEESWFFEAISETYLPMLRVFERLEQDNIPFQLTFSISPTLSSMLSDRVLQNAYVQHLEKMSELADKEIERTKGDPHFEPLAHMYRDIINRNYHDFVNRYKKNILRQLDHFQKNGYLELITSAATHCYLPLYEIYPENIHAQIQTAIWSHQQNFGRSPRGMWIPECGYFPGLEEYLRSHHIDYFFTDSHGILFGENQPTYGVYAPIQCENGVSVFGRDIASSNAVWSNDMGYPGDFQYREFYRDIGFDLPMDYLGPYMFNDHTRMNTGFKYYAITGKTDNKIPYDPEAACKKVEEHAENFLYRRKKQIAKINKSMDRTPAIVTPFDAELFGHWWFEGPLWIESLFRKIAEDEDGLDMITPTSYLETYPSNQINNPAYSSWGNKGYSEVWLDGSNDWIYRHVHKAIERMTELARRYPDEEGLKRRALNQAAREVLLAQASDWPFIMKTGTTVPYAVRRIKEHIYNFTRIYDELCGNSVSAEWITTLEKKNNIFPEMDYNLFNPDYGSISIS